MAGVGNFNGAVVALGELPCMVLNLAGSTAAVEFQLRRPGLGKSGAHFPLKPNGGDSDGVMAWSVGRAMVCLFASVSSVRSGFIGEPKQQSTLDVE